MKQITAFCVVGTRGWGYPRAIAPTVAQCKLNYVSMLYGLPEHVDAEAWWRENAKKQDLRIIKVEVIPLQIAIGKRFNQWYAAPENECCEVDNGGLNVKRCDARAKHEWHGRRICTSHKKMLEAGRELNWIPPLLAARP